MFKNNNIILLSKTQQNNRALDQDTKKLFAYLPQRFLKYMFVNFPFNHFQNEILDDGPPPTRFDKDQLLSLVTGVVLDTPDFDNGFGTVRQQPPSTVTAGTTVTVKFVSS